MGKCDPGALYARLFSNELIHFEGSLGVQAERALFICRPINT
mgnify:CR=1 FL=1